jgi:molybdate transport system substrate-binding protein
MRVIWGIVLFLSLGLAGCSSGNPAGGDRELIVFAASSLTGAFSELAEAFEAGNPGVRILFNFAGSSQLAAQLAEGVPGDVFASADTAQMRAAIDAGRVEAGSQFPFVTNRLTVIVPADNPAGIDSLENLSDPGVALILAVEGVPVREYTDAMVAALPVDFGAGFYANVVSEEDNVRQVTAKIALGEADAGIVYTSDVTRDIAGRLLQIAIPDEQNVFIAYPIAPLADAAHLETARAFIDFVLSPDGQAVLAHWGFGPPPAE